MQFFFGPVQPRENASLSSCLSASRNPDRDLTCPGSKKPIPLPVVYSGMETIRGIPNKYLYAVCLVLSFLMFYAGGVAFGQSLFYGGLFIILAIVLFFMAVHFGRQGRDSR